MFRSGGFLVAALLIAGCSGGAPPTASAAGSPAASADRCARLEQQYIDRDTQETGIAKRGAIAFETGVARCREGRHAEGVAQLERAVRAIGFEPVP